MSSILELLVLETGLGPSAIRRIVETAPIRYKSYPIEKKSGGFREISQPAGEVKLLQRALLKVLIGQLPIHEAALAYREGLSIADNARRHAGFGPVLKLDFTDFFPSIRDEDWKSYCVNKSLIDDPREIELTSRIMFRRYPGRRNLRLAIGAPSSPMLSNVLMYDFDVAISDFMKQEGVIYTRYADDLTFSAPRTGFLTRVEGVVKAVIRDLSFPRLSINAEKTTLVTRKYGRRVTGVVLTNDGDISVGHQNKREIRSSVHRAKLGMLNDKELQYLSGVLAFINQIEPEYLSKLADRYGQDCIDRIKSVGRRRFRKSIGQSHQ